MTIRKLRKPQQVCEAKVILELAVEARIRFPGDLLLIIDDGRVCRLDRRMEGFHHDPARQRPEALAVVAPFGLLQSIKPGRRRLQQGCAIWRRGDGEGRDNVGMLVLQDLIVGQNVEQRARHGAGLQDVQYFLGHRLSRFEREKIGPPQRTFGEIAD